MQASPSSRRRLAAPSLGRWTLALILPAVGGLACQTKSLHPSYALRYHEMQAAQNGARGAHEPMARGDEATGPVKRYLGKLSGDDGAAGGGGGDMGGGSNATAGVRPLVSPAGR